MTMLASAERTVLEPDINTDLPPRLLQDPPDCEQGGMRRCPRPNCISASMKEPSQVVIVPIKDKGDGERSGPPETFCASAFAGPGIVVFAEAGAIGRYPVEKGGTHFPGKFVVAIFAQALKSEIGCVHPRRAAPVPAAHIPRSVIGHSGHAGKELHR